MNIGVFGAGSVGRALGLGWAQHGHTVIWGSRQPAGERMKALLDLAGPSGHAGTLAETYAFGEVLAVALPVAAALDSLPALGDGSGKVLIDATNRFGPSASGRSAAEDLAASLPAAHVVKAFNIIGAEHMQSPQFKDGPASMLFCGDDPAAKATVSNLIEALGFESVDVGDLGQAMNLERLAQVWVGLARGRLGRNFAFKALRP